MGVGLATPEAPFSTPSFTFSTSTLGFTDPTGDLIEWLDSSVEDTTSTGEPARETRLLDQGRKMRRRSALDVTRFSAP